MQTLQQRDGLAELLTRAEELRAQVELRPIAMTMEERGIWRDELGTLAGKKGYG